MKRRTNRALPAYVTFCLGCFGCASPPAPNAKSNFVTPLQLNNNTATFERHRVVARGWLDYGFEKRHLFESAQSATRAAADADEVYDPKCVSIEVPEALRPKATRLNHRDVLVSGIFHSDLANGDVFLGLCNLSGIYVQDIRAVH